MMNWINWLRGVPKFCYITGNDFFSVTKNNYYRSSFIEDSVCHYFRMDNQ